MKAFLTQRWFLLALASVMIVGMVGWDRLLPLSTHAGLRYAIVAGVLFLMALPLEAHAMWRTVRNPGAALLAVGVNFLVLPLATWAFVTATGEIVLSRDMALGLLVTAATPSTLASAAVWTRRAGGNDAVSIMVTVVTNATCFLVTPFWVLQTTGSAVDFDPLQMIVQLAVFVVLPMLAAQLLRLVRPVGRWTTRNTVGLGVVAQLGVLTMVFFGSIQTGQRLAAVGGGVTWLELLSLLLSVLGLHLMAFVVGMASAAWLRMQRPDQIAVGFSGSQKTLMVGLQVSMELGIHILPMVTYHISQLVVDTMIADRLRRRRS